jgi:hypothetical protein
MGSRGMNKKAMQYGVFFLILLFCNNNQMVSSSGSGRLAKMIQNVQEKIKKNDSLVSSDSTFLPLTLPVQDVSTQETAISPEYEWNFMLYIQAKNNLHQFTVENMHQIARTIKSDKIAVFVQWYQPGQQGIRRYKIERQNIHLEYSTDTPCNDHLASEVVDFVTWATKRAPAKKNAFIFSNHGIGILDPQWGNPMRIIQNPFERIDGQKAQMEGLVDSLYFDLFAENERGILFDESRRLYMNNQQLIEACRQIKENVLKKKIDLLGMDACYMQMLEVNYQLAPYAEYFLASEDVELAQGWHYSEIMNSLNKNPELSPSDFAQNIISSYEKLYKGRTNLFTQSAIKLDQVLPVSENVHQVSLLLLGYYEQYPIELRTLIKQARNRCQQFSMQSYVDVRSFYIELSRLIETSKLPLHDLQVLLLKGMDLFDKAVYANTASTYFGHAYGMSIYFPLYRIDNSYNETLFGQDFAWRQFLYQSLIF